MSKGFKVGEDVFFHYKKYKVAEIIKGEIDPTKPNIQHGIVTGYHRKPKKYKLDNGQTVFGNQLTRPHQNRVNGYDFSKPFQAQDLGDEWDDYAWTADDF